MNTFCTKLELENIFQLYTNGVKIRGSFLVTDIIRAKRGEILKMV
jgi:hypothetical protein